MSTQPIGPTQHNSSSWPSDGRYTVKHGTAQRRKAPLRKLGDWCCHSRLWAALALWLSLAAAVPGGVRAQSPATEWFLTTNLSRSGSASQPIIILGEGNTAQAFWWDQFDGLMTAYMTGTAWQAAERAELMVPDPRAAAPTEADAEPSMLPIAAMPDLLGDGEGTVHAFWLVERGGISATGPEPVPAWPSIAHATMQVGEPGWSLPQLIAQGVLSWRGFADPAGGIHVAYIRSQHTAEEPAGLYYARFDGESLQWQASRLVQASIYARLLAADEAHLAGVADAQGNVVIAWQDPHLQQALYLRSGDAGEAWESYRVPLEHASHPELACLGPGRFLAIWQADVTDGQTSRYQQVSDSAGLTWGDLSRLPPEAARYGSPALVQVGRDGEAWLVSGTGGPYLSLCRWHHALAREAQEGEWSLTNAVAVNVLDEETERVVSLESLELAVSERWFHLIGLGQDGEVWAMRRVTDGMAWAFPSDSPWTEPLAIWEGDTADVLPTLVADSDGRLHAWWIGPDETARSGIALWHTQQEGKQWAPATAAIALDDEASHITIAQADGRLHLLWTSGRIGSLMHRSVFQDRVSTPSEWDLVRHLALPAEAGGASSPHAVSDAQGTLHLVYAVPWNENRGIYYARFDSTGKSWSVPSPVIGAASLGWPSVDAPDLVVDSDGTLYATWVKISLTGGMGTGVYVARSLDSGASWSSPQTVVEESCSNPRLALSDSGDVHVFWVDESTTRALWHRRSSDGGDTWTSAQAVPGIISLQGVPDLVTDGTGGVYVIGAILTDSGEGLARYAAWNREDLAWSEASSLRIGSPHKLLKAVSLALLPASGELHALLRVEATEPEPVQGLLHTYRLVTPVRGPVVGLEPPTDTRETDASDEPASLPATWLDTQPVPSEGAGLALGPFWLPLTGIVGMGAAAGLVLATILLHRARSGIWRLRPRS